VSQLIVAVPLIWAAVTGPRPLRRSLAAAVTSLATMVIVSSWISLLRGLSAVMVIFS
jgi:hypothetical protein